MLSGDVLTVGRDEGADIVLYGKRVSRSHAKIICTEPNRWLVVDTNSSNGTYVAGKRESSAFLTDGCLVRFGDSLFRYDAPQRPPEDVSSTPPALSGQITSKLRG